MSRKNRTSLRKSQIEGQDRLDHERQQRQRKTGSAVTPGRPVMLSVYSGQQCVGHLLSRGRQGVEAFASAEGGEKSLGTFTSDIAAAAAVMDAASPKIDGENGPEEAE
jgi:hypothetical protein